VSTSLPGIRQASKYTFLDVRAFSASASIIWTKECSLPGVMPCTPKKERTCRTVSQARNQQKSSLPPAPVGFLLGLLFDSKHGGHMFL
jgi:hypothetical protein